MCRPVNCKTCGKTTWAGCGQHVDQVMAGVPKSNRCPGHQAEASTTTGRSIFSRMFGRG
ncbi:MAG: hypothetical protein M3Y71_08410 [Actinomycetota bacterium]|nr:hypothetical protein [Actinomycetota bacterium]